MFVRPDQLHDPLYVICPIFNPVRYRSRWKLFKDFAYMVRKAGAKLVVVEVAFGERDFALGPEDGEIYIPLRSKDELWIKENAINVAFSRLPLDWKYAAWIDGDIQFSRSDWANDTLHQLQHYPIVQMFSQSADLSPSYDILRTFRSYGYCFCNNVPRKGLDAQNDYYAGEYWHSGYAWAIRRDAFNQLCGLIDFAILGGADLFMANALCNQNFKMPKSLGPSGIRWMNQWKQRADKYIRQNVGYVEGLILHYFHGKKQDRRYKDRGTILVDAHFDPEVDLKRDYQGLWQLNPENIQLRDGIRAYFRQRNEDSIDV